MQAAFYSTHRDAQTLRYVTLRPFLPVGNPQKLPVFLSELFQRILHGTGYQIRSCFRCNLFRQRVKLQHLRFLPAAVILSAAVPCDGQNPTFKGIPILQLAVFQKSQRKHLLGHILPVRVVTESKPDVALYRKLHFPQLCFKFFHILTSLLFV